MELIKDFANNQLTLYCIPILLAIVGILVFTFGFKSAEQPPFDKLTSDDKRQAGKKKKLKEKKSGTLNGHVQSGEPKTEKTSPVKETKRSPEKAPKKAAKKAETNKTNNKIAEENAKNTKKNQKKQQNEKPVDFDDGGWETVPTKADKKKKTEPASPNKKDLKKKEDNRKSAEIVESVEIDKFVKDVVNKELREKEKELKVEKIIEIEVVPVKIEEVIEEKKEKKKEKKQKVEKVAEKVEKATEKVEKATEKLEKATEKVEKIIVEKAVHVVPEAKIPKEAPEAAGGVAFDELGDVWTEAKGAAKKGKKKARRDN